MAVYKRFEVSQQDDVTVLKPVDAELSDLLLQDEFHDELMALLDAIKPQKLVVDFRDVQYCTTGIINSLLSAKKKVVADGGAVKLCSLTRHVHDAFVALNLEGTVFEVYNSDDAAISAFAA